MTLTNETVSIQQAQEGKALQAAVPATSGNRTTLWAGRIISAVAVLFLLFDGITKVIKVPEVIEASGQLGYLENQVAGIGIVLLVCTAIYLIPQSAPLGAILLTGYLGGAVATHVRADSGLFPIVFSLGFGALVWLGLYLRDARVRALLPWQRS